MSLPAFESTPRCVKCGEPNHHPRYHSNSFGCTMTIKHYEPSCRGHSLQPFEEHLYYVCDCGYSWYTDLHPATVRKP